MSVERRPPPWVIFKDPQSVEPLLKTLTDKEDEVRVESARSLGKISDRRVVDPLIAALRDQKEEVRRSATIALGKIKDPRSVPALILALEDEKASVRRRVAVSLGEIQDPRVEELLSQALKKGNLEVVAGAHAFFIRRGEPGSEPILIKALQNFGYIKMAENYFRCGNDQLSVAGQNWARQQGIRLSTNKMGKPLHWGVTK